MIITSLTTYGLGELNIARWGGGLIGVHKKNKISVATV